MSQEQVGVIVTKGPQAWSIIQQIDGFASLELEGKWAMPEGTSPSKVQVLVRILKEDSAQSIIPWTKASMNEGKLWHVTLDRVPAGGLYRIETCLQLNDDPDRVTEWATRGDMIHHIGVGDLWVIAGQSNAAGYGKGPVNDPPELGIHLLRNNGQWDLASHPFNESTNTLHPVNREGANPGHSPFLAFARLLKQEIGWPIGLVQTALGGSPLKAWNPEEDGILYRNMLDIVQSVGGRIRGVVWYQGCSDCTPESSDTYKDRFRAMVEHWRKDVGDAQLPFVTVQLNRATHEGAGDEENRSWGMVREQQRLAARSIPHVTIIPAIDAPLSDEIHNSPAGNLLIGERMARAALATVYGKDGIHYRAPEISHARLIDGFAGSGNGHAVELEFEYVGGYLLHIGPSQPVFSLADDKGVVPVLNWTITEVNKITLVPGRGIQGPLFVSGGSERNPAPYFPLDSLTYMPPLSFFRFPVKMHRE